MCDISPLNRESSKHVLVAVRNVTLSVSTTVRTSQGSGIL